MSERWKMNRIGFVNFWLYVDEDFELEDGKLLLRGQNGSGKSTLTNMLTGIYSRGQSQESWQIKLPASVL